MYPEMPNFMPNLHITQSNTSAATNNDGNTIKPKGEVLQGVPQKLTTNYQGRLKTVTRVRPQKPIGTNTRETNKGNEGNVAQSRNDI